MAALKKTLLFVVPVLGFSFWFFLVFPFAHHNESCLHCLSIDQSSLLDYTFNGLEGIHSYRPVAFAAEWLLFKAGGSSIIAPQVFNYLIAVVSWVFLFSLMRERRVFALISLLLGGGLFTGYLFLFHISGVGYGPILFFISVLFWIEKRILKPVNFIAISFLSLVFSLIHPFAIVLYAAIAFTKVIEDRSRKSLWQAAIAIATTALGLVIAVQLNEGSNVVGWSARFSSLLASYRTTEVNHMLAGVSLLLALITLIGIEMPSRIKAVLAVISVIVAAVLIKMSIPVVLMWILICLIKMLFSKRFAIAALITGATFLPLLGMTGTPTHAIYVLMICAAAASLDTSGFDARLSWVDYRFSLVALMAAIALVVTLRMGVTIPVFSKLVSPIMAEREKTYQMESIVRWMDTSGIGLHLLDLGDVSGPGRNLEAAMDRRYRPPMDSDYACMYLRWKHPNAHLSRSKLIILFGNQQLSGHRLLYSVPGKYAGAATVYAP